MRWGLSHIFPLLHSTRRLQVATTTEFLQVPAHTTTRLTINDEQGEWVFTLVRTGCIRVQRGDFCAYLSLNGAVALRELLAVHIDTQVLSAMGIGDDDELSYPHMKLDNSSEVR
jgi:hypothetical protein